MSLILQWIPFLFLVLSRLFVLSVQVKLEAPTTPGGYVIRTRAPSCAIDEFESCLGIISSVSSSDELAFATSLNELEIACRKLQDGLRCADDHMKRCVTRNQRKVFEEVVQGTRIVITRLCVPGPVQMNYIKYSSCYKNVSKSESRCAVYFRSMQDMDANMQRIQPETIDAGLQNFCCAFSKAYDCQVHYIRKDCGSEAMDFFETNLDEMSNSLIHRHCSSFADKTCTLHNILSQPDSSSSSSSSSSTSSLSSPSFGSASRDSSVDSDTSSGSSLWLRDPLPSTLCLPVMVTLFSLIPAIY